MGLLLSGSTDPTHCHILQLTQESEDLRDFLTMEDASSGGAPSSTPAAAGGHVASSGAEPSSLSQIDRVSDLFSEALDGTLSARLGVSHRRPQAGQRRSGSSIPASTTASTTAASSPILSLLENISAAPDAMTGRHSGPLGVTTGGITGPAPTAAPTAQPLAASLGAGLGALFPLLLAASGPRPGQAEETPATAFGPTGGAQIGDYALGDISRIIDQIMASDPGSRANLPTSQRVVEGLESFTVGQAHAHESSEQVCWVCQEEYVTGDKCRKLPCGHSFHESCLLPWLESHNTCPVCRYDLPTEDAECEAQKSRRSLHANSEPPPLSSSTRSIPGPASSIPGPTPGRLTVFRSIPFEEAQAATEPDEATSTARAAPNQPPSPLPPPRIDPERRD